MQTIPTQYPATIPLSTQVAKRVADECVVSPSVKSDSVLQDSSSELVTISQEAVDKFGLNEESTNSKRAAEYSYAQMYYEAGGKGRRSE